MLFRLCEHYDNHSTIYERESTNECFICFEYKNNDGTIPIYLNSQNLYLNGCLCNGSVHNECLKIWFDKNKKCPICRIKVIENNKATVIIYNYIPFGVTIYTYTIKMIRSTVRVFSCILFICLLIDFYFVIINNKYRQHNNIGYESIEYDDYYMYRQSHFLDDDFIE